MTCWVKKINPNYAQTRRFPLFSRNKCNFARQSSPSPYMGSDCIVNIYYLVIPCHKAGDLCIRTTHLLRMRYERQEVRAEGSHIWALDAPIDRRACRKEAFKKTLFCVVRLVGN